MILIVAALAAVAAGAFAQCPPVPALSTCEVDIIDLDACPTVFPPTLVWCPDGDLSRIRLRDQAIGAGGTPCVGCDLNIRVRFTGQPFMTVNNLWVCDMVGGLGSFIVTTDAAGEAILEFTGGGCGCLNMEWWVEAFSCGGTTLCAGNERFYVKSPDLNGDGVVNFFDTFQYLPQLNAASGYCADFNCDNTVNFFDTFQYLPHMSGGHSCVGGPIPLETCLGGCG